MKQVEITSKIIGRGGSEGITSAIPSINLSGFALKSDLLTLEKKFSDFLNVPIIDGTINRWNELETFLAGISEDYNLLSLLNGKADKSYVDTNFVTIATKQTITGEKNFTGGLKVNGSPIYYDETNKYWKLEGDLLVTGGVTMYGTDEGDLPSILDSLPIASNTALGIASFDSTYFSVDSNGMVTLTSAPSSGASSLGELLNVDASIDATASVDRVLYQPAGSAMWTWRELPKDGVVGDYLPLSGGTITGKLSLISNGQDVLQIGTGIGAMVFQNVGESDTDITSIYANCRGQLIFSDYTINSLKFKQHGVAGFHSILHAGNYSSYALPLSGGQMSGHIYMTGAKAASSIGNTSQIVFGTPSDNHVCITSNRYGIIINRSLSDVSNQIALYADADSESFIQSHLRIFGNLFSNIFFSHGGSVAKQNDASMYTWNNHLQINKIAGMTYVKTLLSFDLVNETAKFNLDSQLRFNSNMFWVSDSTNPYMALVQGGYNWYVQAALGYLFLGAGSSNSLRIDASGNILTPGGITMYSDQRKKTKLQDVELSLSQIANAPLIEHYYNSDQDKTTHVGSIAQYWAQINDWFCKLDAEGFYTMEIQNCALASAISIARHLEKYESKTDKKIRQLKKRISQLEDELELLKKGV